jgi:UrcA family protein
MFSRLPRIAPLALAAAIAMTGLQTAAFAGTEAQVSRQVRYADLDLSTADGQKTLEKRVAAAVREVCGPSGRDLRTMARRAECITTARASTGVIVDQLVAAATNGAPRVAEATETRPSVR